MSRASSAGCAVHYYNLLAVQKPHNSRKAHSFTACHCCLFQAAIARVASPAVHWPSICAFAAADFEASSKRAVTKSPQMLSCSLTCCCAAISCRATRTANQDDIMHGRAEHTTGFLERTWPSPWHAPWAVSVSGRPAASQPLPGSDARASRASTSSD